MILRGMNPDTRKDRDYSTPETYAQTLEDVNTEIQNVNNTINLFLGNVGDRDVYTNPTDNVEDRKVVNLAPHSNRADLSLGRGPYKVGAGDFISVGNNLLTLPRSVGLVRATRRWGAMGGSIKGGLNLKVTRDNPLRVENFTMVPSLLDTEESAEFTLNSSAQNQNIPISFLFEDGVLVIDPEGDVICVKVVGGVLKSLLKFPKKVSINHSTSYTTSKEVASIIGGRSTYNVIHMGAVEVSPESILISPSNISGKAVLVVEDNFFLINGSEPLSLISGVRIDILSGYTGNAKIYTESVEFKGLEAPSDVIGTGSMAGAYVNKLNSKFMSDPDILLEGDTLEGQNISIVFSEGGVVHTNFNIEGGEQLAFIPSEYSMALDVVSTLTPIPTLTGGIEDIRALDEISLGVASIEEVISQLEVAYKKLKSTYNYSSFTIALSNIREAHLSIGLDRAIDVLYSGDLEAYFNLREIEANYASLAAKSTRDVSRRMQSYE